jgi:hypothetical protein
MKRLRETKGCVKEKSASQKRLLRRKDVPEKRFIKKGLSEREKLQERDRLVQKDRRLHERRGCT